MFELLSLLYLFSVNQPASVSLTPGNPTVECAAPSNVTNGFTLAFSATLRQPEKPVRLIDMPGVAEVSLFMRDRNDGDTRLNYCNFRMPDGSIPVMEATVFLKSQQHPDWNRMTIGVPLACLENPYGKHDFVLNFTGVQWILYADGELMDLDFPFGYPDWGKSKTAKIDPSAVQSLKIYTPALKAEKQSKKLREFKSAQYWMPQGFNTWVGDVVTGYDKGRYHVFYLLDRRHHSSKFGKGAHYFEHLSTADFKTWVEHEAAAPIEKQWECIGTGTPFVYNDKLCISYGLHTERIYPDEKTTRPAQDKYIQEHGKTTTFTLNDPGAAIGSSYAVSEDNGWTFKKTWKFFHPCRNPSVYRDPGGKLRLLAGNHGRGMWESDTVDEGWRCINRDFPPGGDCTFFFRWGKFDYIIGGFRNLWMKSVNAPDSEYNDVVGKGLDFYDGLNVPCITEIDGGRFIMAGWTKVYGWGGHLVLRELLQLPDGRIGSRWLQEMVPQTAAAKKLDVSAVSRTDSNSFLLSFEVTPKEVSEGRFCVDLMGHTEKCRFEIDLKQNRAQFASVKPDGTTERQKTLREGCHIHGTRQFAIENLIATDKAFTVRIAVKFDKKSGGSLVDVEIAGSRTMVSFWPKLMLAHLSFNTQNTTLTAATLSPLK